MVYPSKALLPYALKTDLSTALLLYALKTDLLTAVGPAGPAGPAGATGATGPAGPAGVSWAPIQSTTAPAVASGGTIVTAGLTVSRVAPTAAITAAVLAVGTIPGQQIAVINESAFSIVFDAFSLSHVSIGVNCSIAAQTHVQFVWNSGTNLWYPHSVGSTSTPPPTGTFGTGTFGANTFGG